MPILPSAQTPQWQSDIVARFWNKDPSLYAENPDDQRAVQNRLGWVDLAGFARSRLDRLEAFVQRVRASGTARVVLLGMGGSSLCPYMFERLFGSSPGYPRMSVLDTTDPEEISKFRLEIPRSLFVVSSKSGGTIEPNTLYRHFRDFTARLPGEPGNHFAAVTDEHTVLHRLALEERFLDVFINPSDIGGRYSALSFFGLVPAALLGMEPERISDAAEAMAGLCRKPSFADNPGAGLGAFMAEMVLQGKDKLTFLAPEGLIPFGLWLEQLLAESTGKQGTGVIPIVGEPLLAPEQYGDDRCFVAMDRGSAEDSEHREAVGALERQGFPVERIVLRDAYDVCGELLRWEMATALCGAFLHINPFDEPNVAESKANTQAILDGYAKEKRLPMDLSLPDEKGVRFEGIEAPSGSKDLGAALASFFSQVPRRGYVGILCYLPYDPRVDAVVSRMRRALAGNLSLATVSGYGPRYLHSTGQEHKGGPATGAYLLVTRQGGGQPPIPGYGFSFHDLQLAQALGDYAALRRRGRPVLHVHLPVSWAEGLEDLADSVDTALSRI